MWVGWTDLLTALLVMSAGGLAAGCSWLIAGRMKK